MGYITLNKKAFFHNLDYFSKIVGSKDKLCIALKDNAYGHGTYEIASLSKEYGIKHVFVRNIYEADLIKEFEFESVLVLYDTPEEKNDNIIVSINSLEALNKIPQYCKIELKLDTNMNRNGITEDQIPQAIKLIKQNRLILNGVFTHFCCADEDNNITKNQEELFLDLLKKFKKEFKNFRIHCANSAGVHKVDNSIYDIARIGIGSYGYLDLPQEEFLKPVMSLYGKKITTKYIKKGEHIGYGSNAFVASKDIVVSNYDIGYGDGFFRFSENKEFTLQNGLKILGRVSMDSFSVESSDDKIVVFDDVTSLAKANNTIKYEVLATLSPFVPKIILK